MNNDEKPTNVVAQDDGASTVKEAKPKGKARASAKPKKANAMSETPEGGNHTEQAAEVQPSETVAPPQGVSETLEGGNHAEQAAEVQPSETVAPPQEVSETLEGGNHAEQAAEVQPSETVAPPQEAPNRVRYCSTCGTPYLSGARFCANCGRNVYNDEVQLQSLAQNNAIPPLIPHVPSQGNAPVNPYATSQNGYGQYSPQYNNVATKKVKNSISEIIEKIKAFPYLTNVFVAVLSFILIFTALFAPIQIKSLQVIYDEDNSDYQTVTANTTINQSIYDMLSSITYINRTFVFYEEVSKENQAITEKMYEEINNTASWTESVPEMLKRVERIQTKYLSQMNYYGSLITAARLNDFPTNETNELVFLTATGSSIAGFVVALLMITLAIVSLITFILAIVGIFEKKPYTNKPRIFKTAIDIGLAGVIAMSFMTKALLTSCAFSVLLTALLFYAVYAFANQIASGKMSVVALVKNAGTFVFLLVSLCLLCGLVAGMNYSASGSNVLVYASASLFFEYAMTFYYIAGNLPTDPEILLATTSSVMALLSVLSIVFTVVAMTKTVTAVKANKTSKGATILSAISTVFMLALIILLSTVSAEFDATGEIWGYRLMGAMIAAFVFSAISVITSVVLALVVPKKPRINQPEYTQAQA